LDEFGFIDAEAHSGCATTAEVVEGDVSSE
jgi:hypothetical protein